VEIWVLHVRRVSGKKMAELNKFLGVEVLVAEMRNRSVTRVRFTRRRAFLLRGW